MLAGCGGGGGAARGDLSRALLAHPDHGKPVTVWFDATANWKRLGSREQVAAMMQKCAEAGVDVVVVDVKPISGQVLYASAIAPRMLEWKGERHPEDFDLLAVACEEGRRRGLRVFASLNVFAEGHRGDAAAGVAPQGAIFDRPEWRERQSVDYVVFEGAAAAQLVPAERAARGSAIFVSPAHPDVLDYEFALIEEICRYPVDGICLDRLRFSGITADFSPWARRSFEAFLGRTVERWPEDIYTYERLPGAPPEPPPPPDSGERAARGLSKNWERRPGPLYEPWLVWRARTIREALSRARAIARATRPGAAFCVYTGAWYPDYYNEGVNWASPSYDPSRDYAWAPADYKETGYAHLLDALYSGWYYTHLTVEDARTAGVAEWASIEGSAALIERVVRRECPVYASLYLFQYKGDPEAFQRFARAAYDQSDGLMLFDLVYLEEYDWWDELKAALPPRAASGPRAPAERGAP